MTITPFVRRALDVIAAYGWDGGGASDIGSDLWRDADRRGRIASVNGGGDYAAQCLLGRLASSSTHRQKVHRGGDCRAMAGEFNQENSHEDQVEASHP